MLTPLGRPMPSRREATVVGSFDPGRAEGETERVVLPLDFARTLVGRGDLRLDLELSRGADPVAVARSLRQSLPEEVVVETWRDRHRALLFVLALEKSLIFVAVFLIVLVASLALVAAMALLLSSKLADVGALSAMGARSRVLQRAFLLLGLMLGGLGATLGAAAGVGIAWLLDRFELLRLPEGVYIVDHVPFLVRPIDVAAVVGASVLLAVAAATWAARRVGAFEPVEALRS
jgi:lipoprotein-releasing system permease protein